MAKLAQCHPERAHKARGLCDACYQRQRYNEDPDHRARVLEANRRSRQRPDAKERLRRYLADPAVVDRKQARDRRRWHRVKDDPEHRTQRAEYGRRHYQENKDRYRSVRNQYRRRLRTEMINAYGGSCSCCGENDPGFLSLEHLNRDGKAHRMQFGERGNSDGVIRDLKRRGWPKAGYTILCFNCNMGKAVNGGICPHEMRLLRLVTA